MARVPQFTVCPGHPAATGLAVLKHADYEDVPLPTDRMDWGQPAAVQHLRIHLASYVGHLRHANSLQRLQRTLLQHPWLQASFTLPQPLALDQPRWEPQAPVGLTAQLPRVCQRLNALAVPHAVLAQVGHCKTGFKHRALVALWQPRAATPDQPNLF